MTAIARGAAMIAIVAGAAVVPGCALVTIDADLDEGCVNRIGIAAPAVPVTGIHTVGSQFTVDDLGGLRELADAGDPDLHFVRFLARATSGAPADTFAAVDAAHVTIASGDPGSGLGSVLAYDCVGDCPVVRTVLEVPAVTDRSAADFLATGSLAIDVAITGALPDRAWTMDLSLCVSGHVAYSLGP